MTSMNLEIYISKQTITIMESVVYLFGFPISHSLAPLVHNAVFRNMGLHSTLKFFFWLLKRAN